MASPTFEPPPVAGAPRWGDEILIVSGVLAGLGCFVHAMASLCLLPCTICTVARAGSVVSLFSPLTYYPFFLLAASLSVGAMWALVLWRRFAVAGGSGDEAGRSRAPVTATVLATTTAAVLGLFLVDQYLGTINWWRTIDRWLLQIPAMFGG